MQTQNAVKLCVVAIFPLLSGCVSSPLQAVPSNVPIAAPYKVIGKSKGSACQFRLFNVFPLTGNHIQSAIDDALSYSSGDALIGMTIDTRNEYYLLFSRSCTLVTGTAIAFSAPTQESISTSTGAAVAAPPSTPVVPVQPTTQPAVVSTEFPSGLVAITVAGNNRYVGTIKNMSNDSISFSSASLGEIIIPKGNVIAITPMDKNAK
jgi:hypothetical protein